MNAQTSIDMWGRLLAIAAATGGSLVVSLGMVLQKKGIAWLEKGATRDGTWRKRRLAWIAGFALNNSLAVFYFFALKGLSPSVVGAMMGLNIVFGAVFSALLLGERIPAPVVAWSALLVGCIVLANLAGTVDTGGVPNEGALYAFFVVPFVVAALAGILRARRRLSGAAFATMFAFAAGALEGFIIIAIKAAQAFAGDDLLAYFACPFTYLYVVASASVLWFLQLTYAHGRMTRTGPVLWGTQILYPVVSSYIAFGSSFGALQALAFAGILGCVVAIQASKD